MKSIHLLLILLLAAIMPQIAKAQVYETVTTTEDFEYVTGIPENGLPTVMPNGWDRISNFPQHNFLPGVTNNLFDSDPNNILNLIGDKYLFLGSSGAGPLNLLILPHYYRASHISFLAWTDEVENMYNVEQDFHSDQGYLQMGYITNINDASTFVPLQTEIKPMVGSKIDELSQATYSYSLSNIPDNARLAFKWINEIQSDPSDVSFTLIDNVTVAHDVPKTHIANTATSTAMTWAQFAQNVSSGINYEGQTVYLDSNVTATTMVGTNENNCFKGTFEGNNHTLTFNYTATEQYTAPFRYLNGATIRNLKVNGTITTSVDRCAGLAGHCFGNNTITNCLSDITINSSKSGDGSHGGLVSMVRTGTTTFEGCTFTGQLLGSSTNRCGGLAGCTVTSAVFNNCVFDPTEITIKRDNSASFSRKFDDNAVVTVDNCYYTYDFNDGTNYVGQGKQRYTITGQNPVSIVINGTATNHNMSHITAYSGTPGLLYNSTIIAGEGDQVRLNLNGGGTYFAIHGTLTGSYNPHTLTMEASNTVIGVNRTHIANTSTSTTMTWDEFAYNVNNGIAYEGVTVYLNEDIDATTMVGTNENNCFKGTLEGNNHTLTFNYTTNAWYMAPFRYLNGATIRNLKVNGTITANSARCGGLAGHCYGDNTITNCLSDITINSSLNSDGTYGGFVSVVRTGTTTFEGCAFTGRLLGSGTYKSGGLVGSTVTAVVFNNCVFAPTEVTIGLNESATFSREFYPDSTVITTNNSYYTYDFNDGTTHVGQGKQRYTVIGRNPVSVAMDGTATNYDVSHITAYSGNPGLLYDGTIFAGSGEQLSLNLEGSSSYSANHGTLNGTANPYTLGMEACNTIISATPPPTDVLFSTGFEDGCDWTFVNGDRINRWCYGTAAHYDNGTHGIYISNDNGITNAYTDGGTAYANDMGDLYYTMVYAYKTFNFETGAYYISFDWRALGSFTYDYMRAALVPASVTLEADRYRPVGFTHNTLPEGWIALDGGSRLNESTEWQTQYNGFWVPADGNYKVVFAWFNADWYGGQPPAAIDNVSITQASCPTPSNLVATDVTASVANLNWNGGPEVDSYTLKYRTADDIGAPFKENFESAYSFANWQAFGASNTGNNFGRRTAAARTGSYGFSFSSRFNATEYSQYLISPEINATGDLEFYYRASQNYYSESFQVGYSSTGNNVDDFVWGQAGATSYADFWSHFQGTVPDGTKYIAIHYTSQSKCELYIDDITIGAYQVQAGEWQEVTVEGGSQNMRVTLNGLSHETLYEACVYPDCNPDKLSEPMYFRTMETCPAPFNFTLGNVTINTADLSWTGEPDVESYTVKYRTTPDGEWQTVGVTGNTTEVSVTLTGLSFVTAYEAFVYPDCNPAKASATVRFKTEATPTIYVTDFEDGCDDWELINGDLTNQWCWGTATYNGDGTHSLYISDDNGTTHHYSSTANGNLVFAAKTLDIDAGLYNFSYDWKNNGNIDSEIRVFLVPASETLTPSTLMPNYMYYSYLSSDWIALDRDSQHINATEWQTESLDVMVPTAGSWKMVLVWGNYGSTINNPPAAIDNVSIISVGGFKPTNLQCISATNQATTLVWTENNNDVTRWQICLNGDENYLIEANAKPFTLIGLTLEATYTAKVRSITSLGTTDWSDEIRFTIGMSPSYSTDFETSCDWTLVNGDRTNAWTWGTAAHNGEGTHALYISNDGGATNAYEYEYNTTEYPGTVVYAYKTFDFADGVYEFNYDWRAHGWAYSDYLRVALVPDSYILKASRKRPASLSNDSLPAGWIALDGGSKLNLSTEWQTESHTIEVPSGSYKMTFIWVNSIFQMPGNPPAAIDNVSVEVATCARPENLTASNISAYAAKLNWDVIVAMDSYTVKYRPTFVPLNESFENGLGDWTIRDGGNNTGLSLNAYYDKHSGSRWFHFHPTSSAQYLISPMLTDIEQGMRLDFYYKSQGPSNQSFQVGFSSTNNATASFTFGETITTGDYQWHHLYLAIPAGTKYICWKWIPNGEYGLNLDDIMVSREAYAGEWLTTTVENDNLQVSAILTGLTPLTEYEAMVYPDCNPDKQSELVKFTTEESSAFSMTIPGYGSTDGNWHLIALPVTESITPSVSNGFLANNYDLYRFNPLHNDNEWENYKDGSFNLENGQGYLYARSTDGTLTFVGTPYNGNGEFALTYDANDEHKCWNLVGNPFNGEAYLDRPYYVLNEYGTGINPVAIPATTPIPPFTAVFVKAVADGDKAVFTRVTP